MPISYFDCYVHIYWMLMWIASISCHWFKFDDCVFCKTVNLCFRSAKGKYSVKGKWYLMIHLDFFIFIFFFCALEEKMWMTKWSSDWCWVVCQEDEKAKIGPITPTLTLNQTASGMLDVMRGCGKWGWLMLLSVPLFSLHLSECYQTQTHINMLSLHVCRPVPLSNLEEQCQPFISSLVLQMQSFQIQWGSTV